MPSLFRAALWIISGLLIAAGIGWVSAKIQSTGFAPVGISSLVVGAVLGVLLAVVSNQLRICRNFALLIVVALIGLFAVTAQHAAAYRESVRLVEQQVQTTPGAAWFGSDLPKGPRDFVDREILANPNIAWWWGLDAALIVVSVCASFWLIAEKNNVRNASHQDSKHPNDAAEKQSDT